MKGAKNFRPTRRLVDTDKNDAADVNARKMKYEQFSVTVDECLQ